MGQWESQVVITVKELYGDYGFTKKEKQRHIDSVLERVEKEHGQGADVKFVWSDYQEDENVREYTVKPIVDVKKQSLVVEGEGGKAVELPMADLTTKLPVLVVKAESPMDAVRKYWKAKKVESRPCKLAVVSYKTRIREYWIDWAGWNENGGGRTGWFLMQSEEEYKLMRDDHCGALWQLPDSRLLEVE